METKRNEAKMWSLAALMALLVVVVAGCGTVESQPTDEPNEQLGLGYLDPGDSKADGNWGSATTCKRFPCARRCRIPTSWSASRV